LVKFLSSFPRPPFQTCLCPKQKPSSPFTGGYSTSSQIPATPNKENPGGIFLTAVSKEEYFLDLNISVIIALPQTGENNA
jgi:hypothetical protein